MDLEKELKEAQADIRMLDKKVEIINSGDQRAVKLRKLETINARVDALKEQFESMDKITQKSKTALENLTLTIKELEDKTAILKELMEEEE